ncbi:hypothetical protein K443DRAFT_65795, partial [Laccaria amethystina LaAM-08-1]
MTDFKKSTAADIWKRYQQTGSTKNRPRSGRPKVVTDRLKRQIINAAKKSRRQPFQEIANNLEPQISDATIRNVLAEEGYHRRVARKVPYLTKVQKTKRVQWARLHKDYTPRNWEDVIWSDECYVYLGDDRGRVYVTRRADEEYDEDCLVPTFKQSAVRVMVLDGVLRDFFAEMKSEKPQLKFQQDNAPSHRSKSTMKWFKESSILLLFHPPSSPDLSPIEPVWHELKKVLRALPHLPTTIQGLRAAILSVWDTLPIEDVDKHINRMHDRVEAILAAKGGHTRF